MRHLLDANALIWALDDPGKLGGGARAALENAANELLISVGTIWEISIKVSLKKLTLSLPYRQWIEQGVADLGLIISDDICGNHRKATCLAVPSSGPI